MLQFERVGVGLHWVGWWCVTAAAESGAENKVGRHVPTKY